MLKNVHFLDSVYVLRHPIGLQMRAGIRQPAAPSAGSLIYFYS
jgi:hypothetical protein